ncbi:hypothetical protein ACWGID_10235 [Kribbella sp. NPDC054772]
MATLVGDVVARARLLASGKEPQPRGQVAEAVVTDVLEMLAADDPARAGAANAVAGTAVTASAARTVLGVMWWCFMMSPFRTYSLDARSLWLVDCGYDA